MVSNQGEFKMTGTLTRTKAMDVSFTTSLRPSDVTSVGEAIVAEALEFCAWKLNIDSSEAVVYRLRQGDGVTYQYWRHGLAKKVAQRLSEWDEDIQAVYSYDYDATPEDVAFAEGTPDLLIHLLLKVERKTAALNSLTDAMDRALAHIHAELVGRSELGHLLDIQVVDHDEVEHRLGFGSLFSSLYHRPLLVWER
jgi:hypothetical protein